MLHMGDACHLDLNGRGDLLLNLFGGAPGPLGYDLDIVVGYVGIGLDGEVVERYSAPGEEEDRRPEDEPPIVQRKIDQASDHLWIHDLAECEGVLVVGGK